MNKVAQAFAKGDLRLLQQAVVESAPQKKVSDNVDCVRYTADGIEFQEKGMLVPLLAADEVMILPTSVSLCGTDLDLIGKAQKGALPPESVGKIVGHEAAGLIVGMGTEVTG